MPEPTPEPAAETPASDDAETRAKLDLLWPGALAFVLLGPVLVAAGGVAAIGYVAWAAAACLAAVATVRGRGVATPRGFVDDGSPLPHPVLARRGALAFGGAVAAAGVAGLLHSASADTDPAWPWWFIGLGTLIFVGAALATALLAEHPRGEATLDAPPQSRARRSWIATATLTLMLAQLAVPMSYYRSDDIYDERFSWRMFSAVRVASCQLAADETPSGGQRRQTPLMRTVHVAWVNTMKRNREAVMRRYLTWRCESDESLEAARVVNRCRSPEGNELPDVVRRIDCASREIEEGEAP